MDLEGSIELMELFMKESLGRIILRGRGSISGLMVSCIRESGGGIRGMAKGSFCGLMGKSLWESLGRIGGRGVGRFGLRVRGSGLESGGMIKF